MSTVNIDLQLDEVLRIGVGSDPTFVGVECTTLHADKPTFSFTLPTSELPRLIALLTAACARTAQLEAQIGGAQADAVMIAMARHAITVSSALIAKPPENATSLPMMAMTAEGAVIPLALERGAATALLAGLAQYLGN